MTIANPKEEIGTAKVGKHENWIRARTAARDAHAKAPTHISSLTSPLAVAEISQRKENRKMRQLLLSRPECTGGGVGGREEGNNLIWAAARHTFNFDDTGRHQLLMPLSGTGCCLYIARARYNLFALRAAVSLVVPRRFGIATKIVSNGASKYCLNCARWQGGQQCIATYLKPRII